MFSPMHMPHSPDTQGVGVYSLIATAPSSKAMRKAIRRKKHGVRKGNRQALHTSFSEKYSTCASRSNEEIPSRHGNKCAPYRACERRRLMGEIVDCMQENHMGPRRAARYLRKQEERRRDIEPLPSIQFDDMDKMPLDGYTYTARHYHTTDDDSKHVMANKAIPDAVVTCTTLAEAKAALELNGWIIIVNRVYEPAKHVHRFALLGDDLLEDFCSEGMVRALPTDLKAVLGGHAESLAAHINWVAPTKTSHRSAPHDEPMDFMTGLIIRPGDVYVRYLGRVHCDPSISSSPTVRIFAQFPDLSRAFYLTDEEYKHMDADHGSGAHCAIAYSQGASEFNEIAQDPRQYVFIKVEDDRALHVYAIDRADMMHHTDTIRKCIDMSLGWGTSIVELKAAFLVSGNGAPHIPLHVDAMVPPELLDEASEGFIRVIGKIKGNKGYDGCGVM